MCGYPLFLTTSVEKPSPFWLCRGLCVSQGNTLPLNQVPSPFVYAFDTFRRKKKPKKQKEEEERRNRSARTLRWLSLCVAMWVSFWVLCSTPPLCMSEFVPAQCLFTAKVHWFSEAGVQWSACLQLPSTGVMDAGHTQSCMWKPRTLVSMLVWQVFCPPPLPCQASLQHLLWFSRELSLFVCSESL